jgi:hypothetical protein
MTFLLVAGRDPDLYAALSDHKDGVLVRFLRRTAWGINPRTGAPQPLRRQLASLVVDAPLHLVADRVHDLLRDLDR